MYHDVYYDEQEQIAMITTEPLNYTLREYVQTHNKHRNITEKECKLIIIDIIDKLYTMHKSGYIHCDITPDNIMWKNGDNFCQQTDGINDNGWKLIDFGLIMNIMNLETIQLNIKVLEDGLHLKLILIL